MKISIRLPLPNESSVRHQRVLGIGNTYYSWNPETRKFILKHRMITTEFESVMKPAVAMRVVFESKKPLPDLSPLIPPQRPLHRAAWDYGFSKKTYRRHFEAACEAARQLKQDNDGTYRFIEKSDYVFVFRPPALKHAELEAVLWSTLPRVRASDIRPVLREQCRH